MSRRVARSGAAPAMLAVLAGAVAVLLLERRAERQRSRQIRTNGGQAPCRVVVIGAGFGGLHAALRLAREDDVDLTIVDAHNHHLFQPLLYQVATAALAPSDIASPIRGIIPARHRVRVLMETVTGVDANAKRVFWDGGAVPYDELIIATGSRPSYFGHDSWARFAPGLKTLDDALEVRRRILTAFERASVAASEAERARLLTFVLIGAGPTGVEMAGAIAELAGDLLAHDYDMIGRQARIILVEAGPLVLPEFPADLSRYTAAALGKLGVEIRTSTRVTGIEAGAVHLHNATIAAELVIWTAGTEATHVAEWLSVTPGHGGRVAVDAALRVAGHADIHVIGDASLATDAHGRPMPGLAPVAKQQGQYVARAIIRRLRGPSASRPFVYRDYGTLATIGRGRAVAEFGRVQLTGRLAWLTWAAAHIFFLIGFRNRLIVSAKWAFAYARHERGDRLLVEHLNHPPVAKPG